MNDAALISLSLSVSQCFFPSRAEMTCVRFSPLSTSSLVSKISKTNH